MCAGFSIITLTLELMEARSREARGHTALDLELRKSCSCPRAWRMYAGVCARSLTVEDFLRLDFLGLGPQEAAQESLSKSQNGFWSWMILA